ncbi:uncharacterized protein EV420DRAFT_804879 [Desarmillaria tabescens]|uniref:Uncharacterized protein n=1 Tax=Armillaria tabescens TaxID=1929756 RepID=A0AA39NHY9_ARMTA|nr:uncharacterized protein EV420DRAFT_804879 [Desarmillaria tabescens]KAK0465982.1 hypothetical protein EV420DRAFT_804879 [Desarmillaria tabescens]
MLCIGMYTGIFFVTLWNVFTNKPQPIGQTMVILVILVYIATTMNFAFSWSHSHSVFVNKGQNLWTKYLAYSTWGTTSLGTAITSTIANVLAEPIMIWRCWIVWGQQWSIILLPILLVVSATGKIIQIFYGVNFSRVQVDIALKVFGLYKTSLAEDYPLGLTLYASFIFASTLWCTLLIIYRIVTVARAGSHTGRGLQTYHHVMEVLIESYALYSISLILYTIFHQVFSVRNNDTSEYFDSLAAVARGIAPTLLVGRVAAGHARPDDSWQGSAVTSLHFGRLFRDQGSQQDSMTRGDLESQQEREDDYSHHILADSQGHDVGIDSETAKAWRERSSGYRGSTLMDFQEDTDIESNVICKDNHRAQALERPEGGHFNNGNVACGDDLKTQPNGQGDDSLNMTSIVSRDE